MEHIEYYLSGEVNCKGQLLEIIDCTSRGSGQQITFDEHIPCVECISAIYRKTGKWEYYHKTGSICISGNYVALDYIGVPSERHGVWSFFRENGSLFQQIVFYQGAINEITIFDEDGKKIE